LPRAVYGLPEVYRDQIRTASLVASPGCYPTSILLPLIPLLKARLIEPEGLIADSLSGVSGAGRKAELDYLFVECNESMRPYGLPKHRHLSEIEQNCRRRPPEGHPAIHAAPDPRKPRHSDHDLRNPRQKRRRSHGAGFCHPAQRTRRPVLPGCLRRRTVRALA
jgi:hypothetical protein